MCVDAGCACSRAEIMDSDLSVACLKGADVCVCVTVRIGAKAIHAFPYTVETAELTCFGGVGVNVENY